MPGRKRKIIQIFDVDTGRIVKSVPLPVVIRDTRDFRKYLHPPPERGRVPPTFLHFNTDDHIDVRQVLESISAVWVQWGPPMTVIARGYTRFETTRQFEGLEPVFQW